MKNSNKKNIAQIQQWTGIILDNKQMNKIKGGNDGDGSDYVGILDVIDG